MNLDYFNIFSLALLLLLLSILLFKELFIFRILNLDVQNTLKIII